MSLSTTSALQATTGYGPFSSLISVYGLRILGLGDIGGQPAVQDEFLRKTAQTFKLLLNPDAVGINQDARTKALEGLTSYNVIQRVGVGSYDSYSPLWIADRIQAGIRSMMRTGRRISSGTFAIAVGATAHPGKNKQRRRWNMLCILCRNMHFLLLSLMN